MNTQKHIIEELAGMRAIVKAGVSGTLLGFGFVWPACWVLCFVALIPLFSALCGRSLTMRQAGGLGIVTGMLTGLYVVSWFWSTIPLDWIGIHSMTVSVAIISVTWLAVSLMFGLGIGVALAFFPVLKSHSWSDGVLLAALWVLGEVLGAFFFAVHTYGPGVLWGSHFSINAIGYLPAHSLALVQYAVVGGVFGLSALVVLVNYGWFWFAEKKMLQRGACVLVSVALLWLMGLGVYYGRITLIPASTTEPITVAAVHTDIPVVLAPDAADKQQHADSIAAVLAALPDTVDVALLPEGASFLSNLRAFSDVETAAVLGKDEKLLIIDSTAAPDAYQTLRARLEYFDTATQSLTALAYKQFLMPYGEYMPYFYYAVARLFGQDKALDDLKHTRGMRPGREAVLVSAYDTRLVTLFCSDVMSPFLFRQAAAAGAEVFFNVSSYSWMYGSPVTYQQIHAIARVRAVESSRPYVQASNMAPAFMFDKYGAVVTETSWGTGALVADVVPANNRTLYSIMGGWILLLPLLMVAIALWRRSRHRID